MKIIYYANFENKNSDRTEQHIKWALERLGHEVIPVQEEEPEKLNQKADLILFHKGGVGRVSGLEEFVKTLNNLPHKKVCWYFDKVAGEREIYVSAMAEYVDYVFLTDDTWRRRHKYENVFPLRQGIGEEDRKEGQYRTEYDCDVAFVGNVYGEREYLVKMLSHYYKDRFKHFNNVFNEDLYDLCASAKVIVAPKYPADNYYWSSRIYMILGSGGFLIHPILQGLVDEGEFVEGKHYAGYVNEDEIIPTINYFLSNPKLREAIRKQGQKRCFKVATYKKRIEQMLWRINT